MNLSFNSIRNAIRPSKPSVTVQSIPVGGGGLPLSAQDKRELSIGVKLQGGPKWKRFERYGDRGFQLGPSAYQMILKDAGVNPYPKEAQSRCRAADASIIKINAEIAKHGHDAPKKLWLEQNKGISTPLEDGEPEVASVAPFKSRGEWEAETAQKRSAMKRRRIEICAELIPTYREILAKVKEATTSYADKLEAKERETFAAFDVEFVPSKILIAVGQATWRLDSALYDDFDVPPRHFLGQFGIEL